MIVSLVIGASSTGHGIVTPAWQPPAGPWQPAIGKIWGYKQENPYIT